MSTGVNPTITLSEEGEWWVAKDTKTGVVSQGKTRTDALDNLDEALDGYHGKGDEPTTEELREAGIEPGKNTTNEPLPDAFQ
ncbi:type II toxin-antitoxin system HicB family antitoxin [Natronorubrum daqingense]|uniref:HicB family protein n=1 Tax=Natronorubrum daqingense TaxID=588898 RepID=A0A1N7FZ48_9EURY|nr:type II toxin-antitoxin system HicB family antitoxin [Natronorubrum daqingense]APX98581.1 HicB family protein [Natronorubrum daqingense]SIS05601.1 hypothetical protein SAMN05421809_3597 [Natronorubrum daqingense]